MNISICASAGSGKTYALTTEYLRLLRRQHVELQAAGKDGLRPEALLASTFTRKAAGEIFDRVLSRLAAAALREEDLARLRVALDEKTLTSVDCQDLLLRLCRSLHRVSVGTLDSFFQRLCTVYRQEAGLSSNVRLTDAAGPDGTTLAREAIRAVFHGLTAAESDELLDDMNGGKAALSVADKFQETMKGLLEIAEDIPAVAWDKLQPPLRPSDEAVATAKADLLAARPGLPNNQWWNTIVADLDRFDHRAWAHFANTGIAKACLDDDPVFGAGAIPVAGDVKAAYDVLLDVARCELLPPHARKTRAIGRLLKAYVENYVALRREAGLTLFSDAPRLLAPLLGDMVETARRMDMQISHVLLDEFQDTSLTQWDVIGKFALASSGSLGSVFLVGDVKQAIYGWRGGRSELFDLAEIQIAGLVPEARDVSFRSSQVVLDGVNAVFGSLNLATVLDPYAEFRANWQRSFHAHTAHYDRPGFVEVSAPPNDDPAQTPFARCAEKIASWAERVPASFTVGVLVRSNDAVGQMTDLLRAHGLDVSSEGKGAVTDDPCVGIILSVLTMADHPGHTAAAFHAAHSPLSGTLGLEPAHLADEQKVKAVAAAVRHQILAAGYAGVLARWCTVLAPHGLARTGSRLEQLVEQAEAFDLMPPMRPSEFARAMRQALADNPGAARVRVMTINGSKGLEFDTVFLPDLEWSTSARTPKCLVQPNSLAAIAAGEPPIDAVYSYPGEVLRRLDSGMKAAYMSYQGQEVTGLLCLLYVAMTRARHSLHLFLGGPGRGITPAKILCAALGVNVPDTAPRSVWHNLRRFGDEDWYAKVEERTTPVDDKTASRPTFRFRASDGSRRAEPAFTSARPPTPKMAADLLTAILTKPVGGAKAHGVGD